ncbi:MAG: hypothetical protein ABJY83_18795 [Roseibium sp.]
MIGSKNFTRTLIVAGSLVAASCVSAEEARTSDAAVFVQKVGLSANFAPIVAAYISQTSTGQTVEEKCRAKMGNWLLDAIRIEWKAVEPSWNAGLEKAVTQTFDAKFLKDAKDQTADQLRLVFAEPETQKSLAAAIEQETAPLLADVVPNVSKRIFDDAFADGCLQSG